MLGINSSIKNITEKLNPLSQRNKISKLKFERKKDYKTFLDFIKKNTKEIEGTGVDGVKEKLSKGVLGLGGIGIIAALFGGGSGLDPVGEGNRRFNTLQNVIRKRKADAKKFSKRKPNLDGDDIDDFAGIRSKRKTIKFVREKNRKIEKKIKEIIKEEKEKRRAERKQRKINKKFGNKSFKFSDAQRKLNQQATKEIGGDTNINKKSTTTTRAKVTPSGDPINIEQRQFADRNRLGEEPDLSKFERMVKRAEEIDKRIKQKLNDPNFRVPEKIKEEVARINRQLNRKDLRPSTRKRLTERLSNIDKNIKEIQKQNKKFQSSKFFEAPEVPKRKTSKLSGFEKIRRFTNRVTNTPVVKLTTFFGGLLSSPKVEIIKQLLTPTPLDDGTLQAVMDINGKLPGDDGYDVKTKGQFSDKPVNIFLNNGQSMLPFNQDLKLNNNIIPPTDFQTPSNNIFIDPKQSLNIDDLFFLKSFTGG